MRLLPSKDHLNNLNILKINLIKLKYLIMRTLTRSCANTSRMSSLSIDVQKICRFICYFFTIVAVTFFILHHPFLHLLLLSQVFIFIKHHELASNETQTHVQMPDFRYPSKRPINPNCSCPSSSTMLRKISSQPLLALHNPTPPQEQIWVCTPLVQLLDDPGVPGIDEPAPIHPFPECIS